MTLPHGVSPEPDHPTGAVAPELSDGLHVPERAPIAAAEIHQAIGAHIDLIPDDERDKLLLALGARKYALAAVIAVGAAAALFRFKVGVLPLLGVCAGVGLIATWLVPLLR